jgi:hypothetical protein
VAILDGDAPDHPLKADQRRRPRPTAYGGRPRRPDADQEPSGRCRMPRRFARRCLATQMVGGLRAAQSRPNQGRRPPSRSVARAAASRTPFGTGARPRSPAVGWPVTRVGHRAWSGRPSLVWQAAPAGVSGLRPRWGHVKVRLLHRSHLLLGASVTGVAGQMLMLMPSSLGLVDAPDLRQRYLAGRGPTPDVVGAAGVETSGPVAGCRRSPASGSRGTHETLRGPQR